MKVAQRLGRIVPDVSATLSRFPVPAIVAVALFVYVQAVVPHFSDDDWPAAAAAAAAFLGGGAAHLFAEGRRLPRMLNTGIAIIAAALPGAAAYFTRAFATNFVFLFFGLVLLLMIAPFLRAGARQGAIWLFILRFWLAALLASVVALVFAVGISGAVAALQSLFDVATGDIHDRIWTTAMTLVAPLYGLALMPRDLDESVDLAAQKGSLLERGVSVLVNYVAVPVIVLYAAILHVYAAKIAIDGELPRGQIATMVSIFAIAGTATWLIACPWRDAGAALLRLFVRFWFFGLIVPVVLLAIAIWRRLADYGVTPDRYGIVLVALWVAALTLYLAYRRNAADMRAVIGAAAVLLLAGAVGPWGANGLTASSQYQRLLTLLVDNGVIKDGKLQSTSLLPSEAASSGMSILNLLRDVDALDRLRPLFAGQDDPPWANDDWTTVSQLGKRLGFSTGASSSDGFMAFNANRPATLAIAPGAKLSGPFLNTRLFGAKDPQEPMTAVSDNDTITIRLEDAAFTVAQQRLFEEVRARLAANPSEQAPLALEIAPGVTIVVDQLSGNPGRPDALGSFHFWVIQRPPP